MLQTIPLNQLEPSPRNVRKTRGAGFKDLVASIASIGLRQNLSVTAPVGSGPYLVESGGRRLLAMRELAQVGKLPADYPVPCLVVDVATAAEGSLAENVVRQAMHPADEFDAFKVLADAGKTSDEIAERFGCEPRHVEQRLRLANVAPEILADYRAGKADLEQMQALTITADQVAQRAAWKEGERASWKRMPHNLRSALTNGKVSGTSSLARFVGRDVYEEAGGKVEEDLFGDDLYLIDRKLLTKLAKAKLQKKVDALLKEGWKWGEAREEFSWQDDQKFGHVVSVGKDFSDATKAIAGVVVHIEHGKLKVARGLVKPEDRKEASKLTKTSGAAPVKGGKTAKPAKKPGELTFASTQRLQVDATAIVQSALAKNPQRALALLVEQLARNWTTRKSDTPQWVNISRNASGRIPGMLRGDMEESPYSEDLSDVESKFGPLILAKDTTPLEWALAQSTETLLELLAFLVARETEAVDLYAHGRSSTVQLAEAAGVTLAGTWKPTVEWLASLSRTTVIALVEEANGRKGKELAKPLAKLKGEALAKAALPLLPEGWLPAPLRAPKVKAKLDAKQRAAGETDESEG